MRIETLINNREQIPDPAWAIVFADDDKINLRHRGRSWTFETESKYQAFVADRNLNVLETRNPQGSVPIEL